MIEYFEKYLKMHDVEFKRNKKLKDMSSVKIGGRASFVVYPKNQNELIKILKTSINIGFPHKIIGGMTNILASDDDFFGVVIKTDRLSTFEIKGRQIRTGAGARLPRIAKVLSDGGLGGFEELCGIPGSIGGAVIGNAGAFGRETSDNVLSVEFYSLGVDRVLSVGRDELDFAYRDSCLKNKNCIVLSCEFKLFESSVSEVKNRMRMFCEKRRSSQPHGIPSLGSVFKRPRCGLSAGELIDKCGLKGYSVGDAHISEKHAGFIVNKGNATALDYLKTAQFAESLVYERFGIKLMKEIEVW